MYSKLRFRDSAGRLTEKLQSVAEKTLSEARKYYIPGRQYQRENKIYTLKNTDGFTFFDNINGDERIYVDPLMLGTFLPDVAGYGMSFVRI